MKHKPTDPFQAIGDATRRQILFLLIYNNLTINALAKNFEISRPAISKHIKILCEAGFISIENIGRERHCTLNRDGFNDMLDWMNYFDNFWQDKITNLKDLMDKEEKKNI